MLPDADGRRALRIRGRRCRPSTLLRTLREDDRGCLERCLAAGHGTVVVESTDGRIFFVEVATAGGTTHGHWLDATDWLAQRADSEAGHERLRRIADHIPGALYEFVIDAKGRPSMPYMSRYAEQLYGHTPEEIAQDVDVVMSVIPQDLRAMFTQSIAESMATQSRWHWESAIERADSQERHIRASSYPVRFEDGSVHWYGFVEDTTEKAAAERREKVRQSEIEAVFEASPVGLLFADASGRFVRCNRRLEQIAGWTEEILAECGWENAVNPADAASLTRIWEDARTQKITLSSEYRVVRPDGAIVRVRSTTVPMFDGNDLCGWVSAIEDVTAQYESEQKLRWSVALLDETQACAGVGGWSYELATHKIEWTRETYRIHDLDPDLHIPSVESGLRFYPEPHRTRVQHAIDDLIRYHKEFDVEAEFDTALGRRIWVRAVGRPVVEDGELVRIVGAFQDITERKLAEARIETMAFEDALTGLPNRRLFRDRLEVACARALQRGETAAVFFIDIDDFKVVNDSLGHGAGDLLLVEIARRLQRVAGPADTVSRLSGDEFAILLDSTDVPQVRHTAERLLQAMRSPIAVEGRELYPSISVGVATSEQAGHDAETLLKNADAAMYETKANGKAGWSMFEPRMNERAMRRLELETSLRNALDHGGLAVHYQPLVDLSTGLVVGAEALVRWDHPTMGPIRPAEFVLIAEESGLILPLGDFVLRTACAQAVRWREAMPGRDLMMSVNLSGRQLMRDDVGVLVGAALDATGLDPRHLKLEITETVMMTDLTQAIAAIGRLRDLGVTVAVDDFGTGYSSLGTLMHLPVHTVKIDQAFVKDLGRNIEPAAILRAIVSLCNTLGLNVIGEGIENIDQMQQLQALGCHVGQGYFFGAPVAPDDFELLFGMRWLPWAPAPWAA